MMSATGLALIQGKTSRSRRRITFSPWEGAQVAWCLPYHSRATASNDSDGLTCGHQLLDRVLAPLGFSPPVSVRRWDRCLDAPTAASLRLSGGPR